MAVSSHVQKAGSHPTRSGAQLVTFLLKDEEFGFDIMSVQEIIRLPKMARLPDTPDYVEGVANLRGVVLPIFDIRARFGTERTEPTDRSRVLVIDIEGKRTGLLVDGVRQVTRVGGSDYEPPPAAIRSATADYIEGVVKLENGERIVIALDARRVCAVDAKAERGGQPSKALEENVKAEQARKALSKGGQVHQLVSFQLAEEEFAFPMEHVREILRVDTPKEVPGAPAHLIGVLTVRGRILPIVNLRQLLRQPTLAADQIAASRQASAAYASWLESLGAEEQGGDLARACAAGDNLRRWIAGFNSSSQSLMETLAHVRAANEQITKQALAPASSSKAQVARFQEVVSAARSILASLEIFERQVPTSIRGGKEMASYIRAELAPLLEMLGDSTSKMKSEALSMKRLSLNVIILAAKIPNAPCIAVLGNWTSAAAERVLILAENIHELLTALRGSLQEQSEEIAREIASMESCQTQLLTHPPDASLRGSRRVGYEQVASLGIESAALREKIQLLLSDLRFVTEGTSLLVELDGVLESMLAIYPKSNRSLDLQAATAGYTMREQHRVYAALLNAESDLGYARLAEPAIGQDFGDNVELF